MTYTVHYTAPSGSKAEEHAIGVRAAERAMTFSSLGAADVYVETGDGQVFRAPGEIDALVRYAQNSDDAGA
ncbi:hypothetical protein [Methylobacterium organophilum]|uniref:Uncharacterized protein n=1 Tax=Methylobacterium organophilum TaxID=410 RepID=A0ABQ4TAK9_METOR|nr:hypothetical protein [Methylobacterium organophilum]UMY16442.1 hypothetical protein MMB17_17270 [Methylobacterium organophilum]GJE27160.1 hypothetical protein LKMONMHP_2016 [Methylobacterium organophilum]